MSKVLKVDGKFRVTFNYLGVNDSIWQNKNGTRTLDIMTTGLVVVKNFCWLKCEDSLGGQLINYTNIHVDVPECG